ncbi:TPA: hypothetical protein ACN7S0_004078 [Klebsiella pneumoniae]
MKRYSPDCSMHMSHEMAFMRETPDGEYVEYQDHLALKTQRDILAARVSELELVLQMLPQAAIEGGWSAKGISEYAKSLETKLATSVKLPEAFYPDGDMDYPLVVNLDEVINAIYTAGFKCEVSEQCY